MSILFIGIGGIGGSAFSAGLKTVGIRAQNELDVIYRYYSWTAGRRAGNDARTHNGPVVLVWHSAGKKGSDNFCDAFGRKVDLGFAIDSWLPGEEPHKLIREVYSIKAGRGGRFHVQGHNVVAQILYEDETHTSIDDEPKLHDFIIAKLRGMAGEIVEAPKVNVPIILPEQFETVLEPLQVPWRDFMNPHRETLAQAAWQEAFFKVVRKEVLKPLTQSQVDGIKVIVFVWQKYFAADNPPEFLAFILGNAVRETGGKMVAIREANGVSQSDTLRKLDAWWRSGKAQKFGVRSQYWKHNGHGYAFGRGIFQNTHHSNYVKGDKQIFDLTNVDIDLANNYELALDPLVSALLACIGSIVGSFRKRKDGTRIRLVDFWDGKFFDFANSRTIINGDLGKVGLEVEGYCQGFDHALVAAEKASQGWLLVNTPEPPLIPIPVDPAQPLPPVLAPGDALTLENLRKVPSADLRSVLRVSGDTIKLISLVLDERANEADISVSKPAMIEVAKLKGNDMNKVKKWWQSMGMNGGLTALISMIMVLTGWDIPVEQVTELGNKVVELVGIAGAILAMWGRLRADARIE